MKSALLLLSSCLALPAAVTAQASHTDLNAYFRSVMQVAADMRAVPWTIAYCSEQFPEKKGQYLKQQAIWQKKSQPLQRLLEQQPAIADRYWSDLPERFRPVKSAEQQIEREMKLLQENFQSAMRQRDTHALKTYCEAFSAGLTGSKYDIALRPAGEIADIERGPLPYDFDKQQAHNPDIAIFAPEFSSSFMKTRPRISWKNCAQPVYPQRMLRENKQGAVRLSFRVSRDGVTGRVSNSSGSPMLDEETLRALSLCHFSPAEYEGIIVEQEAEIEYIWTIVNP